MKSSGLRIPIWEQFGNAYIGCEGEIVSRSSGSDSAYSARSPGFVCGGSARAWWIMHYRRSREDYKNGSSALREKGSLTAVGFDRHVDHVNHGAAYYDNHDDHRA